MFLNVARVVCAQLGGDDVETWWFAIRRTDADAPHLAGPYPTRTEADDARRTHWARQAPGDRVSVVFAASDAAAARQHVHFTVLRW